MHIGTLVQQHLYHGLVSSPRCRLQYITVAASISVDINIFNQYSIEEFLVSNESGVIQRRRYLTRIEGCIVVLVMP